MSFAVAEPLSLDPGTMGDDISTFIAAQLFEGRDPAHLALSGWSADYQIPTVCCA